jgi:hypothetical protein
MTGDLAKEYARRTGSLKWNEAPAGLQISTSATVAQKRDDGRFRIEHFSHINRVGNLARLVTLTAIVDSTKIASDVTPKNTPVYRSPADHQKSVKPTLTQKDQSALRLELSELKGVKLRTWALAEEIGEKTEGGEADDKARAEIETLLKERRDTLGQLVALGEESYRQGETGQDSVIRGYDSFLEAELDLATDKSERIALYEKRVDNIKKLEHITMLLRQANEAGQVDVLAAKAARLKAEIEFLRARASN